MNNIGSIIVIIFVLIYLIFIMLYLINNNSLRKINYPPIKKNFIYLYT